MIYLYLHAHFHQNSSVNDFCLHFLSIHFQQTTETGLSTHSLKHSKFIDQIFSKFKSAYRKSYSPSHVLMRLIEDWKTSLDNEKLLGTVLMDLSKVFDCIPHDLLQNFMLMY